MSLKNLIWLALSPLLLPISALGDAQRPALKTDLTSCKQALSFTTAVEWEVQTIPTRNQTDNSWALRLYGGAHVVIEFLYNSNFRKLYSFYGQDENGQWQRNYIPAMIGSMVDWRVRAKLLQEIESSTAGPKPYSMKDWTEMTEDEFGQILFGLMTARGQHEKGLRIQKNLDAWDQDPRNQQISLAASEEWKFGKFLNLEFPLAGKVNSLEEIRDYVVHLWRTLGVLPKSNAARNFAFENTAGHVHWVPLIILVPSQQRLQFYQAMIGYWGSINDYAMIRYAYVNIPEKIQKGSMTLSAAVDSFRWRLKALMNYSLVPLTTDVFQIPRATPDGILSSRKENIDLNVDPHFPVELKRTFIGLRSIYDTNDPNSPVVSSPGLESRIWRTIQDNWDALPTDALKNSKNLQTFLENAEPGVCGLEIDLSVLIKRAISLGLDAEFIRLELSNSQMKNELDERINPVVRAAYNLLPLQDWSVHAAVQRRLKKMTPARARNALARLKSAETRWAQRIQFMMRAYSDPSFVFTPDWEMNAAEKTFFSTNRLAPNGRSSAKDDQGLEFKLGINLHPERLFSIMAAGEMMRFIAESGLIELLKSLD